MGLESIGEKASMYIKWKDCFSDEEKEYLFGTSLDNDRWSVDWKILIDLAIVSQGISEESLIDDEV